MAWIIVIVSGAFEAVWAVALGRTEGLSRLVPSLAFAGAVVVSMGRLAIAMKSLPTGTAYAVWVAVGSTDRGLFHGHRGGEHLTGQDRALARPDRMRRRTQTRPVITIIRICGSSTVHRSSGHVRQVPEVRERQKLHHIG